MYRHSLRSLLLSSALAARRLALRPADRRGPTRWRMRWSRPTRPARCSTRPARRCAALDETVPQARAARRPQVGASAIAATRRRPPRRSRTSSTSSQASLNASLLIFDNGQTKAAVESARNLIAAGRADLKDVEQLVLFNAVQAYVDVRRDQEFVRLASNDVERLNETLDATQQPLRGRRGDPHRRQPEPVAPRRVALHARRRPRASSRSRARPTWPPSARAPTTSSRCRRCRRCRRSLDEATAIGVAAQPADRLGPVQRAGRRSTTSTARWRPRGRRSAVTASARRRARQRPVRRLGRRRLRRGRHRRARCRSIPAAATTAWCARRRRCSTSAASSCRTTAAP